MAKPILTQEQRERINAAITEAEQSTRGEIIPVVVGASDDYPGARWRLAVAFAFVVTAAALFLWPAVDTLYLWAGLLPLLAVGHVLAAYKPLLRLALSGREVREEVRQLALEHFFELGLHTTRERTGVLVFVSLLERRIEILADTGIDAEASKDFWNDIVDDLVKQIRAGNVTDGLVEALQACGALLAEHFPARDDDTNELPDEVVVKK